MEPISESPEKNLSPRARRREGFMTPPPKSITPGRNAFAANRQAALEAYKWQPYDESASSSTERVYATTFNHLPQLPPQPPPKLPSRLPPQPPPKQPPYGLGIYTDDGDTLASLKSRRALGHPGRDDEPEESKLVPSPLHLQERPTHLALRQPLQENERIKLFPSSRLEAQEQPTHLALRPPLQENERIKLVPSPRLELQVQPTHRAALESKKEERLATLIRNNGATSPLATQVATIHHQPDQAVYKRFENSQHLKPQPLAVDSKPRDASNSTSLSVPVFLDDATAQASEEFAELRGAICELQKGMQELRMEMAGLRSDVQGLLFYASNQSLR